MKAWTILLGIVIGAGPAQAACGPVPRAVQDRGLHREWRVVEDCLHPERPARLEEIAWGTGAVDGGASPGQAAMGQNPAAGSRRALEVRIGMKVRVWKQSADGEVELAGTALEPGYRGDRIRVRAGLGCAVVEGVVRGPAQVQLSAEPRPQPAWKGCEVR
ncbi:MAG: hypothetical protein WB974_20125 [Acidobacteriaceae bacterium]